MTTATVPKARPEKLAWIKFNPTEWLGIWPELTDEEYGFLHRVIAKLWATPGNRLSAADLLAALRVKSGSRRGQLLQDLTGYVLQTDPEGLLFVPPLDDAFTDAVRRGNAGTAGAAARWGKPAAASTAALVNPEDF